jgi:hypothetical protein
MSSRRPGGSNFSAMARLDFARRVISEAWDTADDGWFSNG